MSEVLEADSAMRVARWQFLNQTCARIDSVVFEIDNGHWAQRPLPVGAWSTLASPPEAWRSLRVTYVVSLAGTTASIPLLMPAQPIDGAAAAGLVTLSLTIGDALTARPVFPAMQARSQRQWEARVPALPSVLRVAVDDPRPTVCDSTAPALNAGPFLFVFAAFVAVLVLWVPLYLWWARRSSEPRASP